ncbi:hypothetical protein O0544_10360 [Edwardsiella anguillarum]|nr:hypothetical protein [Edwardsiella anguillarum]
MRAIHGEKTGFAYADQITLQALTQSAHAARSIVREQGDGRAHTREGSRRFPATARTPRSIACRARRRSRCWRRSIGWRGRPMPGFRR